MDMPIHNVLSHAVLRILRPLARVLLSHGMAYGTFAELARRAFAEEGFLLIERSSRRPTVSAVSAITGMTRKEVSRLREAAPEINGEAARRYSRAIRVISGWLNDAEFLSADGGPAVLPVDGDSGSFSALVRRYSGDIPPAAMLSILQGSNNVAAEDGRVVLRERAYIPMATPTDKINILGKDVGELIHTIGHNLEAGRADRFFQRKVSNASMPPDALREFREISNRKSQELLEEYNAWLSRNQVKEQQETTENTAYVAVGIYYIELSEQEYSS